MTVWQLLYFSNDTKLVVLSVLTPGFKGEPIASAFRICQFKFSAIKYPICFNLYEEFKEYFVNFGIIAQ